MDLTFSQGSLVERPCDVLIVNLFEGVKEPGGATGAVDKALDGLLSRAISEDEFEGKLGSINVQRMEGKIPAAKVVLVGLGKSESFGVPEALRAAGAAARKCRELGAKKVISVLHGAGIGGLPVYDCARATALGTLLGVYEYNRLKTEGKKDNPIESFEIVELSKDKLKDIKRGIGYAEVVGEAVTFARDLANEPSNFVTPTYLAGVAEEIARDNGLECRIWDREGIKEAGMGLLWAVGRGSAQEPRFIELKYKAPKAKKTIAIVGKGLTFDSGGYSLKLGDGMYGMKDDMAGAAAVLSAIRAIAKLKPKVNVVALAPATENMIGGNAIHPGDVFTSLAGKNVEINNTDAEGRLILADAVAHAKNLGVDEIIDCATLTGACISALGTKISGVMSNNQGVVDRLLGASELCGEKLWQLPLFMDYKDCLKSDVADLKNSGGHGAGPINGALFIESFVGDTPWAHIDMASSVAREDTEIAKKGSTGVPTGTLIEYIMGLG